MPYLYFLNPFNLKRLQILDYFLEKNVRMRFRRQKCYVLPIPKIRIINTTSHMTIICLFMKPLKRFDIMIEIMKNVSF